MSLTTDLESVTKADSAAEIPQLFDGSGDMPVHMRLVFLDKEHRISVIKDKEKNEAYIGLLAGIPAEYMEADIKKTCLSAMNAFVKEFADKVEIDLYNVLTAYHYEIGEDEYKYLEFDTVCIAKESFTILGPEMEFLWASPQDLVHLNLDAPSVMFLRDYKHQIEVMSKGNPPDNTSIN